MHTPKNMAKATAIAFVLLMASVVLMTTPAQAQTYTNMQDGGSMPLPAGVTPDVTLDTVPEMSFRPNPVGIGQPLLVNLWMHPTIHASHYFKGYKVTFTKPDGTTDVKVVDSYRADSTAWFEYIVDQIGTWKIKFDFPGGYFPAGNYTMFSGAVMGASVTSFPQSAYYKPNSDGPYDFVVQQNMVWSWPESPLPTDYWTRPVSPENREWWPILGNYPATGVVGGGSSWPAGTNTYMSNYGYVPYVQAPNSAHIVWKQEQSFGGLFGPGLPADSYQTITGAWIGGPSIIYQGRCYATVVKSVNGVITSFWDCYDLRTGQLYWEQTGLPAPTLIEYEPGWAEVPGASPGQGRTVYLVAISGGRMIKYDPYTGAVASTGSDRAYGPQTRSDYNISIAPLTTGTCYANPFYLSVQNIGTSQSPNYRLINWSVQGDPGGNGGLTNVGLRIYNNISWPFSSLGTVDYETGIAVTTYNIVSPATTLAKDAGIQAASLTTGQLLWNITAGVGQPLYSGGSGVADHGKYAVRFDNGLYYCFDLYSGKQLWKSEPSTWPWGTFASYGVNSYGGLIISNQYDGVAAYNWTNGKLAWLFQAKVPYPYETPYQDNYPFFNTNGKIADGKFYSFNTEHTVSQPVTRGWRLFCINATTGENIWNVTGSMAPVAIADGYLVAMNYYDNFMYVFGKGKSATTVTAPTNVAVMGDSVLIQGTVLDQSPSQPGTPCVSADSVATEMEYLHMQHPIDGIGHNLTMTGVPVTLTAIDSTGTVTSIGTTTTNAYYGTFSYEWAPPKEDKYTITASFAGDDSYGSSSAATALAVGPAIVTPSIPETIVPDYTMTIVYAAIAIIAAVAIVGLLILLAVRKR